MKNNNLKSTMLILAIAFLFAGTAVAPGININNIENNNINLNNLIIISITYTQIAQLNKIMDEHLDIISVKDQEVTAYVNTIELKRLNDLGFNTKIIFNSIQEMNDQIHGSEFLAFHTYATLTADLQNIANTYPDITQLYDLGHSVQGRVLWGLKITDNPTIEEDEPEVRFCGNHHGNEYMGVELCYNMALYLVQNYESNPDIEDLVDNREIWIIPMVNPDGRESSTRYNAHGVDLNRDYGYVWGGEGNSPSPFSQPETQIMRQNALDNNFVLSVSYHTTEAIVNYIWNYKGQPVADYDVTVQLSQQYGSHNGYWVVEGYDWYQTRGDTNDFSYGCRGDIDWTVETQNSDIPSTWNLNRDAMLEIIDAADIGLRGIVKDAETNQPIAATVWVEEAFWPCFTDPALGDYHKVLLPGAYNVHYTANGYEEQIINVEVDDTGEPTVQDVYLNPSTEFYAYQVTLCDIYDPYGYPNNFQNNPTEVISALGAPDGVCASLGVGGYVVLDMGAPIIDHEDENDFIIYEGDSTQDGYIVYVSSNWSGPWTSLGTVVGTAEFDLANYSIESAQFVKIVDDGSGNPSEQKPGVDIDAVQHIVPVFINNPPNTPNINGQSEGEAGVEYEYRFITTDPEVNDVYYWIDWGDNNTEEWAGPYPSGQLARLKHTWVEEGTYNISAKAKDIYDAESGWKTLQIIMPRTKTLNAPLIKRLVELFPNLFYVLKILLK